MDRLNGSARLMLVSDLDYTMVDPDDPEDLSLFGFNALWESYYRHDSLLVFSTGRSPVSYKQLRNEKPLLTPDIAVMSVGTEIMYGDTMVPDLGWVQFLNQNWDRDVVVEEAAKFPQLIPQSEIDQRPHKVSFYVDKVNVQEIIEVLSESLDKRGLVVKIIYSSGIALDILPRGAGKGKALAYLLKKLANNGKLPVNTLVCGDSGNDAELFTVPQVYGVMVMNAQEELLQWYAENMKANPNIIHANERCAAGIMQAIGEFGLGTKVSPRDISDFQIFRVSITSPSITSPDHEVIKFYLIYETWLRADTEKSEQLFQNLKSFFYLSGSFVHPSGVEKPIQQCLDAMEKCYGDRKGKQFRVWVDRATSLQIGSDTWLVKCYKWESYGKDRQCCLTTILMTTRVERPNEFIWLHVHQTWLDGLEMKRPEAWIF